MRDVQRMVWLFVAVLAMAAMGCGDDDSGGSPDSAVTDDGGTAPDGSTQPDGGSTPDAGPVTEQYLELQLSATVITEQDEAGAVTASCLAFDTAVSETPLAPDPGDPLVVEVTGLAATTVGDVHSFTDHGQATVTCSKAGWSLSAQAQVTVIGEWVDPRYATVAADLGRVQAGLRGLRNAQNQDDALAMAAHADLLSATTDLDGHPLPADAPVLRDIPGGLPDRATIEASEPPTADDTPYAEGLTRLRQHLQASAARLQGPGMDPTDLSQADVDTIAADAQVIQDELTALVALAPGPGAVLDSRTELAELLLNDLPAATSALAGYVASMAESQEPGIKFGFISLAMGCFNTSNIYVTLINKVYGKYLGELDAAFNTLIIGGIIDTIWPPVGGGPEITFTQASASASFACPGYASTLYGYNFNATPAKNVFIIIGANVTATAEAAWNAINVGQDDTIFDVVEKLQEFQDAVQGLGGNVILGTDVYPDALGPGEDGIFIGPWPDTNPGSLPSPVHIIPINHDIGRGLSYQLSELGNC